MKKILLLLYILFNGWHTQAQTSVKTPYEKERNEIGKILLKFARQLDLESSNTFLFSIKVSLSVNQEKDTIYISKYTPRKLSVELSNPKIFKHINWQNILSRPVKDGDVIIIPITYYQSDATNPVFYPYTIDALFQFSDTTMSQNDLKNVTLMEPIVTTYLSARRRVNQTSK